VAYWDDNFKVNVTTEENDIVCTKHEVNHAHMTYDFVHACTYSSMEEAIRLLEYGNLQHVPDITHADIVQASKMYASLAEYIREKLTKKTASSVFLNDALHSENKSHCKYSNVMHVDGEKFLMSSVTDLLQLALQSCLASEGKMSLGMALQSHLSILMMRGFERTFVYTDPQSAFCMMTNAILGVKLDTGGAGDYVDKVGAKICCIKETYRFDNRWYGDPLPSEVSDPDGIDITVVTSDLSRYTVGGKEELSYLELGQ